MRSAAFPAPDFVTDSTAYTLPEVGVWAIISVLVRQINAKKAYNMPRK
jgi:hypothetical protein